MASGLIASCGAAFHAGPDNAGGAPSNAAGRGGEAEGGASSALGGNGGVEAVGGDGGVQAVGGERQAGGSNQGCGLLGGEVNEGHCYVDVTIGTATQPTAVAACEALGPDAHLLVLDTPEEQEFVLATFLYEHQDSSDAWLGLTCSTESHPAIEDCYCKGCTDEEISQKQAAWSWLDGTSTSFGWVNDNPNGAARCAALAYNPTLGVKMPWGWVERNCDVADVAPIDGHPHTYRTICELPSP